MGFLIVIAAVFVGFAVFVLLTQMAVRNASCFSADSDCIGGGLSFVVAFGEMGGGEMPTGRGVPAGGLSSRLAGF